MSRRRAVTWAPTSMPDMRRHFCNAMDAVVGLDVNQYKSALAASPSASGRTDTTRLERLFAKLTSTAATIKREADALRGAELYWVTRDMVDVVLDAATSLPEWTPALAAPTPTGFLCWAKSAGTVASGVPTQDAVEADLNNPGFHRKRLTDEVTTVTNIA